MIFVVLGMHKSGTTLISQQLHQSGIAMIDSDLPRDYEHGNKFERPEFQAINQELLNCPAQVESIDCHAPTKLRESQGLTEKAKSLLKRLGETQQHWGFKDPRTSLSYPFWSPLLPAHRIIVVVRPLHELWQRYSSMTIYRRYRGLQTAHKMVKCWYEYNLAILAILNSTSQPALVLSYRHFMENRAPLAQLAEFIDAPIDDLRQPGRYRARPFEHSLWLSLAIRKAKNHFAISPQTLNDRLLQGRAGQTR
jgi:hypothetical protein